MTLTDDELFDKMFRVEREIFGEENELRLLSDRLNMTAMEVRASMAGLSEPQIWLAIWQDEKWREIYARINKTHVKLVDFKAEATILHHRLQYASMVRAASITASIAQATPESTK